jgi:hypothetical protein
MSAVRAPNVGDRTINKSDIRRIEKERGNPAEGRSSDLPCLSAGLHPSEHIGIMYFPETSEGDFESIKSIIVVSATP